MAQNKRKYRLSEKATSAIRDNEALFEALRNLRGVKHITFQRQLLPDKFPWWMAEDDALAVISSFTGLSKKQILKEVA